MNGLFPVHSDQKNYSGLGIFYTMGDFKVGVDTNFVSVMPIGDWVLEIVVPIGFYGVS
jgi:hypothetical protein